MTFHLWPLTLLPYDLHHLSETGRGKGRENELRETQMSNEERKCQESWRDWGWGRDTTAADVKEGIRRRLMMRGARWRWGESQQWMTACTYCNHMFGAWWLGNQLVWPSCRCCHVSLITNRMTGNINYPNLFVITIATHTIIGKSLVLNCMSLLITAHSNSLSLSLFGRATY